jgi:ATPase subunit of ABC transporter with duplicated ATPase domains
MFILPIRSTLLRRIASGTLPGFPPHLKVSQVRQGLPVFNSDALMMNPVDYVIKFDPIRRMLLRKIDDLENGGMIDDDDSSPQAIADALCTLYDLLEDEGLAISRATNILRDLGFGEKRRSSSVGEFSGGWRMRLSFACALFQDPNILLLDEPTNHLDMEGVEWLVSYLKSSSADDLTVVVVSHDSHFLDEVCTDIIRFAHKHLQYYVGKSCLFFCLKNVSSV